ncbi:argininosuccinate synthetase [Coccidioides immitis]|nr:argininosuccinate synthetase [Coccidioides immitis]
MANKEKVLLAYSGGLDTSCILAWLIEQGHEVVCFLADVGQAEDFKEAERKALAVGAKKLVVEDLKREFVEDLCFRAIQCNVSHIEDATRANCALLTKPPVRLSGRTDISLELACKNWKNSRSRGGQAYSCGSARPVIARAMMRVAKQEGCTAVSHGCTGKGNDQVRFELAFYAIQPSINVIAPWRLPEFYERFAGRNDLLDYAAKHNIPVTSTKAKPWSMDENLAHCSYEAGILEEADVSPPDDMWKLTDDPRTAPNTPEDVTIFFEKGLPVGVVLGSDPKAGNKITDSLELFTTLNELGRKHGIGRIDIVENRYIGLKSVS